MEPLPHTRHCFVCGIQNPAGFGMHLETDRRVVETRFRFRPEWCGFPETVHGGLIGTALDEVMVWAVGVATGHLTYCGEMTVRYQRPTRPGVDVLARAELVENRRNRLFLARASLLDADGHLLAESTGKYLPLPAELYPRMFADFIGDPSSIFRPSGTTAASGHLPGTIPGSQ